MGVPVDRCEVLERESAHEKQGLREHKIKKAKNTTRELFTQILKGDLAVRMARWWHRRLEEDTVQAVDPGTCCFAFGACSAVARILLISAVNIELIARI